ncbi:MAG: J domain-containing protein [Chloroflexi bacterium]|nr:J domain-containing protein [Chloroflexota bacterium]
MSDARDPYEVLGVPRTASVRQIRAAYVERARRAHPDLVGQRGLDVMRSLNEAWAVLKDAERRIAFDVANGGTSSADAAGSSAFPNDPNRPFWTGAAGPPPGRPWGSVLDFGIYAGWSLGEISRRDRGYLMWLRDRPEASAMRLEILRLIDPNGEEPVEPRRSRR